MQWGYQVEQYVTVAEITGLVTVHGQLVMVKVVAWRRVGLAFDNQCLY